MTVLLFLLGLLLLIGGAEILVQGSSRLAGALGISPLIIGLTVVAFGTSSPELAVSVKASLSGQGSIAVGNIVGSNIINTLFILGISALIIPLRVSRQLIRLDVPLLIILSTVVFLLALDGNIGWMDSLLLVAGLASYLGYLYYQNRSNAGTNGALITDPHVMAEADEKSPNKWGVNLLLVAVGLALLVIGSRWLVDSAVVFARHIGVSELVIGLTVVAAGTSLPEVVTSVIAAIRGERDIAVGNIVGSNLFNLMAVLGIAGLVAPEGIEIAVSAIHFDLPVMVASAVACLPIFFTGGRISRWEGAILAGYYLAYTVFLIMAASEHDALAAYSAALLYFAIPLTLLTLGVVAFQELKKT